MCFLNRRFLTLRRDWSIPEPIKTRPRSKASCLIHEGPRYGGVFFIGSTCPVSWSDRGWNGPFSLAYTHLYLFQYNKHVLLLLFNTHTHTIPLFEGLILSVFYQQTLCAPLGVKPTPICGGVKSHTLEKTSRSEIQNSSFVKIWSFLYPTSKIHFHSTTKTFWLETTRIYLYFY